MTTTTAAKLWIAPPSKRPKRRRSPRFRAGRLPAAKATPRSRLGFLKLRLPSRANRTPMGVDTAAETAQAGGDGNRKGKKKRLSSDNEMEGMDAAATIARPTVPLPSGEVPAPNSDDDDDADDPELDLSPNPPARRCRRPIVSPTTAGGQTGSGVAIASSTSQVDMLSAEADFVMRRMIGRGGQGEVWRAWQSSLHREVAVKRMISGDLTEFLQEAYTSAELDHPQHRAYSRVGARLRRRPRSPPAGHEAGARRALECPDRRRPQLHGFLPGSLPGQASEHPAGCLQRGGLRPTPRGLFTATSNPSR
jgi:hypothetical protein